MKKAVILIGVSLSMLLVGCGLTGSTGSGTSTTGAATTIEGGTTAPSEGNTTATTVQTLEDGTPWPPPGIITDVDPDTVTEDEKADEVQQFREAITALAKNTAIDRLEISQKRSSGWKATTFTRREQIDEWIDMFLEASLTAEPRQSL